MKSIAAGPLSGRVLLSCVLNASGVEKSKIAQLSEKAPDTLKLLEHVVRASLSAQPKVS